MSGVVAQAWIWSVPPPPTARKLCLAKSLHTALAPDGVYLSSWKLTTTWRPQTLWLACSQNLFAPALNELFGNGVPVPVSGACSPMLIVEEVIPVVLPP